MYATVRVYAGRNDLIAGMVKHEDSVKSAIGAVPGFRSYYIVETPEGGAASITVCNDQAGAEESNRRAAAWITENLPGLSIPPPSISAGKVAISF